MKFSLILFLLCASCVSFRAAPPSWSPFVSHLAWQTFPHAKYKLSISTSFRRFPPKPASSLRRFRLIFCLSTPCLSSRGYRDFSPVCLISHFEDTVINLNLLVGRYLERRELKNSHDNVVVKWRRQGPGGRKEKRNEKLPPRTDPNPMADIRNVKKFPKNLISRAPPSRREDKYGSRMPLLLRCSFRDNNLIYFFRLSYKFSFSFFSFPFVEYENS